MIAVIDMTGDGWGFVGKLHRMGYAVSWVVECDVEVGFEALPMGFRGVVHRVGLEDFSQMETAVRGCEEVLILVGEEMGGEYAGELAGTLAVGRGSRLYLVVDRGGSYEVEEMDVAVEEVVEPAMKTVPLLVRHVG